MVGARQGAGGGTTCAASVSRSAGAPIGSIDTDATGAWPSNAATTVGATWPAAQQSCAAARKPVSGMQQPCASAALASGEKAGLILKQRGNGGQDGQILASIIRGIAGAMNIDFLAADGHKWLCAPDGCGLFYCRRDLLGHLRPTEPGYLCMKGDFDTATPKFDLRDDARRFDSGAYNIAGVNALGASIELFLEVGVEEIQKRVKLLTDRLVEGLKHKGWRLYSPRTASEWSGIISFASDKHDLVELQRHLRDEFRIVVARRLGRLRASPHFYNTEEEIDQLIDALPVA